MLDSQVKILASIWSPKLVFSKYSPSLKTIYGNVLYHFRQKCKITLRMAKKILIVEDDNLLSKMYKAKFESEGFEVLTALEGELGLKTALSQLPDLILLDMMMPKLSGMDFLAKLRTEPKTQKTPVIVLSNLTNEDEAMKAKQLGAVDYLAKASLTPGQVVEKVRQHL